MTKPFRLMLGNRAIPLNVEALLAEEQPGALAGHLQGPCKFDFIYRDVPFAAAYEETESGGHMKLVGDVGPLPFSAQSAKARFALHMILEAARRHQGDVFKISRQGVILVGGEMDLETPVTVEQLLAVLATFLVRVVPYLECIAVYLTPPAALRQGERALAPQWRRTAPR